MKRNVFEINTEFPNWCEKLLTKVEMASGNSDLHLHTVHSDGSESLEELVKNAKAEGLSHIAVTDHDIPLPSSEAEKLTLLNGIHVIPGVELNCEHYVKGKKVIVHLGILWPPEGEHAEEFQQIIAHNNSQDRIAYVRKMFEKLYDAGLDPSGKGLEASLTEMLETRKAHHLGKGTVAEYLVEKHCVKDRDEAFRKYLSRSGKALAFVPAEEHFKYISMEKVMHCIQQYNKHASKNAVVSLNHIFYYGLKTQEERECLVRDFVSYGGKFIELHYPTHDRSRLEEIIGYMIKYYLTGNGGSDRHGPNMSFYPSDEMVYERILAYHLRKEFTLVKFEYIDGIRCCDIPYEFQKEMNTNIVVVPCFLETEWGLLCMNEHQYQTWLKNAMKISESKRIIQSAYLLDVEEEGYWRIPNTLAQYVHFSKNGSLRAYRIPDTGIFFAEV